MGRECFERGEVREGCARRADVDKGRDVQQRVGDKKFELDGAEIARGDGPDVSEEAVDTVGCKAVTSEDEANVVESRAIWWVVLKGGCVGEGGGVRTRAENVRGRWGIGGEMGGIGCARKSLVPLEIVGVRVI